MRTNLVVRLIDMIERKLNIVTYWKKRGLIIGNECEIYQSVSFGSEPYLISIGNKVRINRGVEFVTHDGGIWVLRNLYKELNSMDLPNADLFGEIIVGNNVHIGTNAIIMPNVVIGNNCIIGCGAIVTHDIPDNSISVGIPARIIGSIEEYFKKHEQEFDYTKNMTSSEKREYLHKKYHKKE